MKNFLAHGDVIEITATADIKSSEGVVVGTIFGVAMNDIANGEKGPIKLSGVYDLPKAGSQAWTEGAAVHWDAGNKRCTTAATGNRLIGCAIEAVGGGAGLTAGKVRLNGIAGVGNVVAVGS
ncbi:DUF2190 family protein [Devosia sp. YIM 151766]|uniref:DUF2190 family protein n=1 Tax=Devosia sp. YIM 151766 TaxID=3017325 RepID=UPI00255CE9B6|nr:DUF2190 family protein [Devosia sp. YIM 151766]WIY52455.1 DUF2190 family protein [Devosia sp. YIM 151766]